MDDHTFFLLQGADEKIRRSLVRIERQRLHILSLIPSRRSFELRALKAMLVEHTRLVNYRKALLTEPSRELMN